MVASSSSCRLSLALLTLAVPASSPLSSLSLESWSTRKRDRPFFGAPSSSLLDSDSDSSSESSSSESSESMSLVGTFCSSSDPYSSSSSELLSDELSSPPRKKRDMVAVK